MLHTEITIDELLARWDAGDGKPYKGKLIDWSAYQADPTNIGCMCAQGQVLNLIGGMTPQEIHEIENQKIADEKTMALLGISRGQAILLRHINDKVDGAPSIVLTHPEKVLGEHAQSVLAFFKYLDAMTADDWQKYYAAGAAAWDAARAAAGAAAWDAARAAARAAAWDAARAAARAAAGAAAWAAARAAAWDAARAAAGAAAGAAAWDAARAAAGAANEIQGHKILEEKGKPLFFLSLFGFKTVQTLVDWASV